VPGGAFLNRPYDAVAIHRLDPLASAFIALVHRLLPRTSAREAIRCRPVQAAKDVDRLGATSSGV